MATKKRSRFIKEYTPNFFELLPIIIFIALTPLIVHFAKIEPFVDMYWLKDNKVNTEYLNDFFAHYKSILIYILSIISVLITFFNIILKRFSFKNQYLYYPLLGYIIFVILSLFMTKYSRVALFGYNERFEGTLIIGCYLFMFIYIIQNLSKDKHLIYLIRSLIVSWTVMCTIGFFQLLKMDFFKSTFGKKLILPKDMWHMIDNLQFPLPEGTIYQTLYHSNYVGLFLAMAIPFSLTFFICEKRILKKVLWGLFCGLLFINLIGSKSRGGIVGITISMIVLIIFLRKQIFKWWKAILVIMIIGSISFIGIDFMSNHLYSQRIKDTLSSVVAKPIQYNIRSITTDGYNININYKGNTFSATYDPNKINEGLKINDHDNKNLTLKLLNSEKQTYTIDHPDYNFIRFQFVKTKDGILATSLTLDSSVWNFALLEDGVKYINPYGKFCDLNEVATWGYEGRERLGSARGYIWSRSIPLIKDHIFVGSGADTYAYIFPQNDYVGKYNAYDTTNMIVDKPHNIYLQATLNTGLLSLICLIIFWSIYIVWCCRLYFFNQLDHIWSITGIAVFLAICGYLGAGIFNDANVSVGPIYWGLFGIGIVSNQKVSKFKKFTYSEQ